MESKTTVFQCGDLVVIKGLPEPKPVMTITAMPEVYRPSDAVITCVRYDSYMNLHTAQFSAASLELAPANPAN